MADDDDTDEDREDGAADKRQGSGFDTASLTPETVLAQLLAPVADKLACQTLANRLLANLTRWQVCWRQKDEDLLAFDDLTPEAVKSFDGEFSKFAATRQKLSNRSWQISSITFPYSKKC